MKHIMHSTTAHEILNVVILFKFSLYAMTVIAKLFNKLLHEYSCG